LRASPASPVLFVDVLNQGTLSDTFEMRPRLCCLSGGACAALLGGTSVFIGIRPGLSARFTFPLLAEGRGYCDLDVLEHADLQLSHRVSFAIALATPPPGTAAGGNFTRLDASPEPTFAAQMLCGVGEELQLTGNGSSTCLPSCGTGMTFDRDRQFCRAIDCSAYGPLAFYNASSGACQPCLLASCLAAQPLLSAHNSSLSARCGPHGNWSVSGSTCVCAAGWTSAPQQSELAYRFCSVQLEQRPDTLQPVNPQGSATGLSLRTVLLLSLGGAALLVLLVATACLAYRCRHRLRGSSKTTAADAQETSIRRHYHTLQRKRTSLGEALAEEPRGIASSLLP
jgi:hypothetical protein